MAKIFLAWELGGGSGHLVNFSLLLSQLSSQGHQVFLALRDLSKASAMFKDVNVSYLQAPYQSGRPKEMYEVARTFAHIMFNIGFGDVDALNTMVDAWRNLIEMVGPDLILIDHSPTALLAARGYDAPAGNRGKQFLLAAGLQSLSRYTVVVSRRSSIARSGRNRVKQRQPSFAPSRPADAGTTWTTLRRDRRTIIDDFGRIRPLSDAAGDEVSRPLDAVGGRIAELAVGKRKAISRVFEAVSVVGAASHSISADGLPVDRPYRSLSSGRAAAIRNAEPPYRNAKA